ncbi:MAG TPA: hypothetical protein VFF13_02625 [archaeon]|nr:hypothetical protein [archaeon]
MADEKLKQLIARSLETPRTVNGVLEFLIEHNLFPTEARARLVIEDLAVKGLVKRENILAGSHTRRPGLPPRKRMP